MAKSNDNNQSYATKREREEIAYAGRLAGWRRMLINEPATAEAAIGVAMAALKKNGVSHKMDLDRAYSQMKNGVSMPGEFGVNSETGVAKRA